MSEPVGHAKTIGHLAASDWCLGDRVASKSRHEDGQMLDLLSDRSLAAVKRCRYSLPGID